MGNEFGHKLYENVGIPIPRVCAHKNFPEALSVNREFTVTQSTKRLICLKYCNSFNYPKFARLLVVELIHDWNLDVFLSF